MLSYEIDYIMSNMRKRNVKILYETNVYCQLAAVCGCVDLLHDPPHPFCFITAGVHVWNNVFYMWIVGICDNCSLSYIQSVILISSHSFHYVPAQHFLKCVYLYIYRDEDAPEEEVERFGALQAVALQPDEVAGLIKICQIPTFIRHYAVDDSVWASRCWILIPKQQGGSSSDGHLIVQINVAKESVF